MPKIIYSLLRKTCLEKIQIIALKSYMWKSNSDWCWCLGGAYFLAKFQAGGAYSGGANKKSVYNYWKTNFSLAVLIAVVLIKKSVYPFLLQS